MRSPAHTLQAILKAPLASFRYTELPASLVITAIAINGGLNKAKVAAYAQQVEQVPPVVHFLLFTPTSLFTRQRSRLPFFIESSDHVKLFIKMCICTE